MIQPLEHVKGATVEDNDKIEKEFETPLHLAFWIMEDVG
jgi:hypothetical protein